MSPHGVVTEKEEMQKERGVKESSLKCAKMINIMFSLVLIKLSPTSQTYPPVVIRRRYLNRDPRAPSMLSQILPMCPCEFFTGLDTSTGRKA